MIIFCISQMGINTVTHIYDYLCGTRPYFQWSNVEMRFNIYEGVKRGVIHKKRKMKQTEIHEFHEVYRLENILYVLFTGYCCILSK